MSEDTKEGGLYVDSRPASPKTSRPGTKKDVRKRWMILAGIVILAAFVISSALSHKPPTIQPPAQKAAMLDLTPKGVGEKSWQAQSQAEIQAQKDQIEQLNSTLAGLQSELADIKAQATAAKAAAPLPSDIVPPPGKGGSGVQPITQAVPPPPLPPESTASGSGLPPVPSSVPPPYSNGTSAHADVPLVFSPSASPGAGAPPMVKAQVSYKKNPDAGMLVAGAFAPVVLLNGVDAGTASMSRSNPQPVLMRVQNQAILPGAANYSLRSCFLLGSGYGDLSSERVYIRLARLSCVDKGDHLVLSAPVQGYVVDSDNTLGLRGKVIDRQGAKLGKALIAGFAQGLSGALGGSQGTTETSILGTTTAISGSEALRASGLSGASTAAGQIAQFYLKEAESIFPVISVKGGRTGTVVFTQDANLEWGSVNGKFIRTMQPAGTHQF
ncbi:MAG: TraB/VirB10 family protein [Terriglobia bacterium]|nr:TraB/VirB10 family protein [Terriglobia bacterium]